MKKIFFVLMLLIIPCICLADYSYEQKQAFAAWEKDVLFCRNVVRVDTGDYEFEAYALPMLNEKTGGLLIDVKTFGTDRQVFLFKKCMSSTLGHGSPKKEY